MPVYTFQRPSDGACTKRKLTFDEFDLIKAGHYTVTDEEGETLKLSFDPKKINFTLKDGPSGGWVSKSMRENKYRQERASVMAQREKDHVFKTRLVPNLDGKEAHSWKDVRDEVHHKKGALAASTFDRHVAQESK